MITPIVSPALVKIIGGLSLALLFSLGGNAFFFYHIAKKAGLSEGEAERKTLAANNAGLEMDAGITKALSERASEDNTVLMSKLESIAVRGQETRTIYRTAAAQAPLAPNCGPGKLRMDAVNKGLGPVTK